MNESARDVDESRATADRPPARKHRSHRFKVARRKLGRVVALSIAPPAIRGLSRTWRRVIDGEEHVRAARANGGGYFMALWHGRMLVPAAHHGHQGYSVLVSPSGDGDVSEALLEKLGYGIVRGSTGRRASAALREMLRLLRAGKPIAITPDGPRGPPRTLTQSLAWMASATGFPVVPCGFVGASAWHLNSWDRFTIPKPFSRIALVYGEPIYVERRGDDDLALTSDEIRRRMDAAEARGFELLGVEPDR